MKDNTHINSILDHLDVEMGAPSPTALLAFSLSTKTNR